MARPGDHESNECVRKDLPRSCDGAHLQQRLCEIIVGCTRKVYRLARAGEFS